MAEKLYFYSDCRFVKGVTRSAVYNLRNGTFFYVPTSIYNVLISFKGSTYNEVVEGYSKDECKIIDEYLQFLFLNNLACWVHEDEFDNFPELKFNLKTPEIITNSILDIDSDFKYDLSKVMDELVDLGCRHFQIKSYEYIPLTFFKNLLTGLIDSIVDSIEIITKNKEGLNLSEYVDLLNNYPRANRIIMHSSKENKTINTRSFSQSELICSTAIIKTPKDCHNLSFDHFSCNYELFSEAQNHHSYFNKKVCISTDGDIKNCNSHVKTFGSVNNSRIGDVVTKNDFQKLWLVKKDLTMVCCDCEHRYMCVDSREPIKNGQVYYHKEPCKYDPVSTQWSKLNQC